MPAHEEGVADVSPNHQVNEAALYNCTTVTSAHSHMLQKLDPLPGYPGTPGTCADQYRVPGWVLLTKSTDDSTRNFPNLPLRLINSVT